MSDSIFVQEVRLLDKILLKLGWYIHFGQNKMILYAVGGKYSIYQSSSMKSILGYCTGTLDTLRKNSLL